MKLNYLHTSWVGTTTLLITGLLATLLEQIEVLYAIVSLAIFGMGVALCLMAFIRSLGRSRYKVITTADLFLLSMSSPRRIRISLWGSFSLSFLVGIVLAAISSSSNFAFGILASVFPLGNVNMWAISHGSYTERTSTSSNYESDDYE